MIKLRDYQNEARLDLRTEAIRLVKLGYKAPKILCVLPTRSGKTVLFCDMAGRVIAAYFDKNGDLLETKRVLIITHRKEIFDQTVLKIAEFGMTAGQIRTGKSLTKNPIQVAMVGTLKNLLQKQIKLKENGKFKDYYFVEKPDLIIWDECFIAGTKITTKNGQKNIEDITNKDVVLTFNENKKKYEYKRVEKLIKKENKKRLVTINNHLTCTEDHEIYTQDGWVKAASLITGVDMVWCIMIQSNKKRRISNVRRPNRSKLFSVCKGNSILEIKKSCKKTLPRQKTGVLFYRMHKRILSESIIRNNGKNKQSSCFCTNDKKQPHEKSKIQRKDENYSTRNRTRSEDQGRKRSWSYDTSISTSQCDRLGYGSSCNNSPKKRKYLPYKLQNRYCQRKIKNRNRSRWKLTRPTRETSPRQKENRIFKWVGVENIKIQKQRDRKEATELHKKSFVYDLTIKDNHNYFANNILVHNCHHCVSDSWKWVFAYYKDVMQIGFTATAIRLDNKPLGDIFQSLVVGKSTRWMIENYWLTNYIHKIPKNLLKDTKIKMRGKDYDKPSQVEKLTTIQAAASIIKYYKMYLDGLQTVVFCCNLLHAEKAKIIFEDAGYKTQIISSKTKNRDEIMKKYKLGDYPILISIDIISEGVDLPLCYGVIFLRLTASLSLYLQMISRCLTPIYADGYDIEIKEQRKIAMNKAKPYGIIIDMVDNGRTHGKLDEHREWSLTVPPKKRKGENKVKMMDCPCGASYFQGEVKVCELCGHDFEAHRLQQKKIEIEELSGELVDIHSIIPESAESLAKTILNMKKYSNKRNMMLAHLHKSINLGEKNIKKKIAAMCAGLEFSDKYKHVVWSRLLAKYPEKLIDN